MKNSPEEIVKSLSEKSDFSDGDLLLEIVCKRCDARYAINPESIAMALIVGGTIWDYIKYVQHSKCEKCNDN